MGETGKELGLGPSLLWCGLPALQTTNNEPKQETKKQKQETKQPKNQENQKTQDCTPQGGSSGRELGLVIFFVFLFLVCSVRLVWFSHCGDAKQKLSMAAQ